MDEELLRLCCQEFATEIAAENANPFGSYGFRHVIRYPVFDRLHEIAAINNVEPQNLIEYTEREIRLQQLPSGFWAWLPTHPEDIARVSEFKLSDIKFGQGMFLQADHRVPLFYKAKLEAEEKNHIFAMLKSEVLRTFANTVSLDSIYKISISQHEGLTENFGGSWIMSCRLIYCEQV